MNNSSNKELCSFSQTNELYKSFILFEAEKKYPPYPD